MGISKSEKLAGSTQKETITGQICLPGHLPASEEKASEKNILWHYQGIQPRETDIDSPF